MDVIFLGSATDILERFNSLRMPRSSVVFSGEYGCWPMAIEPFGRQFCEHNFHDGPYRFINSGVWAGYAPAVFAMLTETLAYMPLMDQWIVNSLFVSMQQNRSGQPDRLGSIVIDSKAVFFQSIHGTRQNPDEVQLIWRRGISAALQVRNTLTGSWPLLLHFNGGAKDRLATVREKLLRRTRCLPPDASVANGTGGRLPLVRMCPDHELVDLQRPNRTCKPGQLVYS